MRLASLIPILVLAIAAVLAVAVRGLSEERERLRGNFMASQRLIAQEVTADLRKGLTDLDEDARLVSGLVERARRSGTDRVTQDAAILSGFQALATIVRHYSSISLFDEGDSPVVSAIDPSEGGRNTPGGLVHGSRTAARRARGEQRSVMDGPRSAGDPRPFYFYASPASPREVVVLAAEARLLLRSVLRPRAEHVRYVVVDPDGSLWLGCAALDTCRVLTAQSSASDRGLSEIRTSLKEAAGATWLERDVGRSVGLSDLPAVVAWESAGTPAGGRWSLAVVASAVALEARERSLLRRLLLTSIALVISIGGIGSVIVWQQRRSAALRERLIHAQELAHLRERSDKIVSNVPVGILATTRNGEVAIANRFLQERIGPIELGVPLETAFPASLTEGALRLRRALDESVGAGRTRTLRDDDIQLIAPEAGYFDVRIIPMELPAADIRALVLIDDLSEIKSLEKQLVRAEKLATVGVLTAGIAHEIGTPLGIIRGRAESLLERSGDLSTRPDLSSIVQQIDRIAATIRQVLDFSRAQPVELRPVDAAAALQSAISLLDWRIRQKVLSIRIDGPAKLPAIAADPDQLQQVLVNLLINACDACSEGGALHTRVSRDTIHADRIRIEIRDDGCGIRSEDLNAVFDPFFTTKKRGEGTGLGLPVAASIVRNHRGELSLTSEPGKGTTATILWPMAPEPKEHHV